MSGLAPIEISLIRTDLTDLALFPLQTLFHSLFLVDILKEVILVDISKEVILPDCHVRRRYFSHR